MAGHPRLRRRLISRSRRSATAGSGSSLTRDARVALRPLTDEDLAAAITPWYEEALAAATVPPVANGERLAIVRVSAGDVIGRMDYRADDPARGWLSVGFIALAAAQRGWGYGSEAVRLVEAEAKAARFRADVDAGNGLALYFWLRLGYRPARPEEVPGKPPRGIITMVRDS